MCWSSFATWGPTSRKPPRLIGRSEEEQIEAEGDAGGGGRGGLEGTIDGEEDVEDGGGVEVGNGGGALVGDEVEGGAEGFDGAFDAVAGGTAEFDEVLRRRDGDEEAAVRA